ncbi:hypothetical protein HGA34_02510 [Candidatus Falkowbacteria bacterium]|nr:hypothetical protein [Candidatus Falkowbacteria bacterium]
MKRYLSNLLVLLLLLNFAALPASVFAAPRFDHSRFTVSRGWTNGSDEHWHIIPTGERTEFVLGDKVQFFAQVGPINYQHQWRLVLYRNNSQYRIETNPRFYPDYYYGWNYSNFVPYMTDLPVGEYRAHYQLDSGAGFESLANVNFRVVSRSTVPDRYPDNRYTMIRAVVASGWQNGSSDHWNIQPTGQKTSFRQGETVYLVSQLKDVKADHRYRIELYRTDGPRNRVFENITPWNRVGRGWTYSNYQPYYSNAEVGNYEFRLSIDTGSGWRSMAVRPFKVTNQRDNSTRQPYYYDRTTVSRGWQNGSGSEYWNIRPVDPRSSFNYGDDIFAVSTVRNIVDDYQWKAELYRNGQLVWQDSTPWRDVGMGHAFGSYYPRYDNAMPGNYEWRIYLNTGSGFKLLDTKNFTVSDNWRGPDCNSSNNYCNYDCRYYNSCNSAKWSYNGATVAENWTTYGGDQRNLQAVNPRNSFNRGATVYIVAQARDVKVDHRWAIETYRNNSLLWTFTTPWNRLRNTTWPYSSVVTSSYNSDYGSYEFRVFFDEGSGFRQVDSKYFYVNY